MRFRVTVPVYVECNEIEVVVDHEGDPPMDEEGLSEIFEKAIRIAIKERPIVPWMAEERSVLYEMIPDISKLIRRIED